MNWDMIEGNWKELSGKARQRWGKLTDDDWQMVAGKREELIGRIQQRYGKNRDEAEKDVDEWGRELH
ncbi:MAG: CsbD family protein [Gammaproteobacteria bacterium]|nr:CsbD family protein [Gammaproteobacteria bacterium]